MRNTVAAILLSLTTLAAHGATFVVSNTLDAGAGSLRQAILDANATPGHDAIDFSIGTGPQTIDVGSPLVVTSPLTIDGATQSGFRGTPLIRLFGTGTGNGLELAAGADGSAVRNLELVSFYGSGFFDAAAILVSGANDVAISGNYIGGAGDVFLRNRAGVRVFTTGNEIGGLTAAARNVFVNSTHDIELMGSARSNVVRGNYFGFDPTGLNAVFPASMSISIAGGSDNVIGGTEAGARNVIRGGGGNGIQMSDGATGNRVQGNYIGLRADGTASGMSYGGAGITMSGTGGNNLIGGTTAAARNVIGNNAQGISIGGALGIEHVYGNYVGTNVAGTAAIPNQIGVLVGSFGSAVPVTIGGTGAGEGNLISGNSEYGIYLSSASAHIEGNLVGTDVTGLVALPNGAGIQMVNHGAIIGTGTTAGRNVIAGNTGDGIEGSHLAMSAANAISGNYIGTGADGTTRLGNGGHGITLASIAGGEAPVITGNVIAFNGGSGVNLAGVNDAIVGGTAATANRIVSNGGSGVLITSYGFRNLVRANSIDSNGGLGIDLGGDGVTANDGDDTDAGPNELQNSPTLVRALGASGSATVTGTLSSRRNTSFTLDFYASPSPDPSGFGEGAQHVGSMTVVTNASGQASYTASVAATGGSAITATATSVSGTSEFSNSVTVEAPGTLRFDASTYSAVEGDAVTITVTRHDGSTGTVTVDYATSDGTAGTDDYVASHGTLTFVEGQATATFTVVTARDTVPDSGETFVLTLSNPTGGSALTDPAQATVTITETIQIPTFGNAAALFLIACLAFLALRSVRIT